MSLKVLSETNKKGVLGWRIRATVYVPNPEMHNGKQQLVVNRFVSRNDYPTLIEAKKLGIEWEEKLSKEVNHTGPVTLGFCIDIFLAKSRDRAEQRKAKYVKQEIGNLVVDSSFKEKIIKWGELQRHRKKLIRKKGTNFEYEKGSVAISESTVRNYLRIIKTSINKGIEAYPELISKNPVEKMKIGRNLARKRIITTEEKEVYVNVINNHYPWFYFPWLFSTYNMTRPQDQYTLKLTEHVMYDADHETWAIEYQPKKTKSQVLEPVFARPVVFDELKPFFSNLHSPAECDNLFVRPGLTKMGEDPNKHYPITQKMQQTVWKNIRNIAAKIMPSCADIKYYDWRHFAVGYLLENGLTEVQIMDIAGWTSPEMIWRYYPRNKRLYLTSAEQMRKSKRKTKNIPMNEAA